MSLRNYSLITPKSKLPQLAMAALRNPNHDFITKYDSIVPDISELVNYNIGLVEARPWHSRHHWILKLVGCRNIL